MADALLLRLYKEKPIDWAGGHDLGSMNERRKEYILALRAADAGDFQPLFAFAGIAQGEKEKAS
jgi:fido (protein-threonine AMPylation protein)